jgi:hypothetical protein
VRFPDPADAIAPGDGLKNGTAFESLDLCLRLKRDLRNPLDQIGVTTPNVKNRTLRNLDHSLQAVNGRRGLNEPLRRRPAACQAQV